MTSRYRYITRAIICDAHHTVIRQAWEYKTKRSIQTRRRPDLVCAHGTHEAMTTGHAEQSDRSVPAGLLCTRLCCSKQDAI